MVLCLFAHWNRATHRCDTYKYANNVDPDGAPHNVAPSLGLHWLLKRQCIKKIVVILCLFCQFAQSDPQVGYIQSVLSLMGRHIT